jgi:hypothetical protein
MDDDLNSSEVEVEMPDKPFASAGEQSIADMLSVSSHQFLTLKFALPPANLTSPACCGRQARVQEAVEATGFHLWQQKDPVHESSMVRTYDNRQYRFAVICLLLPLCFLEKYFGT